MERGITQHTCEAASFSCPDAFAWTKIGERRCCAPAGICVRISGEKVWLCANHYDEYIEWCCGRKAIVR